VVVSTLPVLVWLQNFVSGAHPDGVFGVAVLSTPPGRVEAMVLRSKILLHGPQPGGSWSAMSDLVRHGIGYFGD